MTEVVLGPQDGLEDNQKYVYTVTAINTIGMTTSNENIVCMYLFFHNNCIIMKLYSLVISDVQIVNVTVVGESTIDIQCWFIHGSDALGCKVVLVSDCPNVSDVHANLSRSDMSASGQLNLINNISCYLRVFAFDIDVNNTVSNLTIEGIIKPMEGVVHTGNNGNRASINLCSYSFFRK